MKESASLKKSLIVTVCLIFINLVLFFIKLYIGLYTGSISIYTDAVNNLLDCVTCVIATAGFYLLAYVRSEKYPFGFGRAEDIVTFIMSAVIIVAGCSFVYSSLERLIYPSIVTFTAGYAVLISVTALVKLVMAVFLSRFAKNNDSAIIDGIRLDSILDFFISLATVMSLIISEYVGAADGIMGLVISVVIIVSGVKMVVPSVKKLLGRRDDNFCAEIKEYLESLDCVQNVIEVHSHSYGRKKAVTVSLVCTDVHTVCKIFKEKFDTDLYVSVGESQYEENQRKNNN